MVAKITGAQRDFSFGEVDVALKRADGHPARKGGLRQAANTRILNSGAIQNRSGRRALYPATGTRTERFSLSPGNVFDIQFAPGLVKIIDATGTVVFSQGGLPWVANNLNSIVYAILGLTITVTFGHLMRPQVLTWDGVSTWTMANYVELSLGFQKRTPFYRIAPQGITIQPAASVGRVNVIASAPYFTAAMIGIRLRYIGRQLLITEFSSSTLVVAIVQEPLTGSQQISFGAGSPQAVYSLGDEVIGSVTGSKGLVCLVGSTFIQVQLLSANTTAVVSTSSGGSNPFNPFDPVITTTLIEAFLPADIVTGPAGSLQANTVSTINAPLAVAAWDEEVMNDFRGYPASCFTDQFRLGFCDFPSVPGGIGWSSINAPTDMYVGPNPADAMFEIAPAKVQVFHVVPGPESSEFVFTDRKVYYIPISPTNPLKSGSVQFLLLSGDGASKVIPRLAQEAILYINAGQNSVMAVIATGAYLRPFNTKNLSEFHAHLFNNIQCIAAPSADGAFNERYAYILNGDGSIAVGKYDAASLGTSNVPTIGWVPWSGNGTPNWIATFASDVIFTTAYFGALIVEILDDGEYLDAVIAVNGAPPPFTPPGGKGPLWFIPSQTVSLMDQASRSMGTYQIDANGFIVPQFNAGENLAAASLVAGQPWTMIAEPFCPDAEPGNDVGQRMFKRRISRLAVYVINSTGFLMARLFSGPISRTSPALGTIMNTYRVTAWNQDDDPTLPPPQREEVQRSRPLGRSFDPRVAIIKDTPGPLLIAEIGIEATV